MKYCKTCFEKVNQVDQNGDCIECTEFPPKPTKKPKDKNKFKAPDDGEEWVSVPSPYKAYKEGV